MPNNKTSQTDAAERALVEELRIEGYGAVRDATFRFTPLHALIGPNDSGKSTVLRALRTLSFLASGGLGADQEGLLRRALQGSPGGRAKFHVSTAGTTWEVEATAVECSWRTFRTGAPRQERGGWARQPLGVIDALVARAPAIVRALSGAQLLRLDPDALRAPHSLIPDSQPLRFVDERGTGLPAVYDAVLARDLPAYQAINAELCRLFPDVETIRLVTVDPHTKGIGVKLTGGTFVPADLMSEGLLYSLAFAVLPHLEPTALLLVEEPENGLHPARIAEVVRVLRAISQKTQVLVATHSPLVVNELSPEEVTVVTRNREGGTRATRIHEVPHFEERSKVYALGELWLSYADGKEEAPLLDGGPRP